MFAGTDMVVHGVLAGLQHVEHELLLFAAFWFVLGTCDELAIDLCWLWLRLTGRAGDAALPANFCDQVFERRTAILVPAWHEATVIGAMIAHTLRAWQHRSVTLYIGCYRNDAETVAAAVAAAANDGRLRVVIHDRDGPTTKADCLNRLYVALETDEVRCGERFDNVILHDAEDMVHPDALGVIDRALQEVDFVQLPVRPEPQPRSHWIAGHYSDEFTEAHAKTLVVRDALGAAIPAAGVGCGFSRDALVRLAITRAGDGTFGPFSSESLTEDYELGLLVSGSGRGGRFVRVRDADGALVATRAFFPATLDESVRQKTRWIHGIALQGWDRLGWEGRGVDVWMALRDRRGPLMAIVLAAAYGLLAIEAVLGIARAWGWQDAVVMSPLVRAMLAISFASFIWRAIWRFGFTAHEYGLLEGFRAVLRFPVGNVIAIMAGRRALVTYVRTLRGGEIRWDKTSHHHHPAALRREVVSA